MFSQALVAEPGQVVHSDFTLYAPGGDAPSAFLATPVLDKRQKTVGVIAVRLGSAGVIQALTKNLQDQASQNIYLVSPDGVARSPSVLGDSFGVLDTLPDVPQTQAVRAGETGRFEGVPAMAGGNATALVMSLDLSGFDWSLVMETDEVAAFAELNQIRMLAMAVIGGSVLIAIVVSLIAARRVTIPILALRQATNALAETEYDIDITGKSRSDELGDLARSLDSFRDKLKRGDEAAAREVQVARQTAAVVEETSRALSQLQAGNLACDIQAPFDESYETLRENFNQSLINLRDSMGEVISASEHVGKFSQEQSAAADEMAHRTESQAATLEQTASALRDLTANIGTTAEQAAQMDEAMTRTRSEAEDSTKVVTAAVSAMDQIQQTSSEISKIINMIDDIAFQTNLLALNAGVEAARAGQSGAGFAVVASEVRALALRTSTAAGQIQELTSASESHVANGVEMVGQAGQALSGIIGQVGEVSGLVSAIAKGVQKQSQGLEEINGSMETLDGVTQQNAAMAEEASASSQLLQQEATSLSGIVGRFDLGEGNLSADEAGPAPTVGWQASSDWEDGADWEQARMA